MMLESKDDLRIVQCSALTILPNIRISRFKAFEPGSCNKGMKNQSGI